MNLSVILRAINGGSIISTIRKGEGIGKSDYVSGKPQSGRHQYGDLYWTTDISYSGAVTTGAFLEKLEETFTVSLISSSACTGYEQFP
jgi:hypothetical protein